MVLRMSETGNDLPPDVAPPAGEIGAAAITRHLRTLPMGPGVYRMIDGAGEILYIGKARSLRKRVTSYTKPTGLSIRIQRMVRQVATVEVTTTHTEAEEIGRASCRERVCQYG